MDNIRVYYRIIAWDKAGKVIHRSGRRRSHSFLKQFIDLLFIGMQETAEDVKDVSGATGSVSPSSSMLNATGAATFANRGIVIGTDAAPEAITDFKLGTRILNGIGAGQMLFALQTFDAEVAVSAPNASFSFTRNFTNNSGAAITVREVGVILILGGYQGLRDTPSEIAVPDGGGCQVTYTIQVSVL